MKLIYIVSIIKSYILRKHLQFIRINDTMFKTNNTVIKEVVLLLTLKEIFALAESKKLSLFDEVPF